MKLIVALGNPGKKYELTRHNAGFLALDFYLEKQPTISCQSKFHATICELHSDGQKVFFVKPQTFMNDSGKAVREITDFYKVAPNNDILVIHDDSDLAIGTIREANDSSSAGHRGVQSIIDGLGTQQLHRVRIGVESRLSRSDLPTDEFVLQPFTDQQLQLLKEQVFPAVADKIESFLHD